MTLPDPATRIAKVREIIHRENERLPTVDQDGQPIEPERPVRKSTGEPARRKAK